MAEITPKVSKSAEKNCRQLDVLMTTIRERERERDRQTDRQTDRERAA